MLFNKTLLLQLLVVVLRPAAFIWSISILSSAGWAGDYLIVLGLIPIFATLDMLFQSVARYRHLRGVGALEVLWMNGYWVVASALVIVTAAGYGVIIRSSCILSVVLISVFVVAACFNLFEARISSKEAIFDQSAYELIGFGVCVTITLAGHQHLAAFLVNAIFPMARLLTVYKHRSISPNVPISSQSAGLGSVYVGNAIAAQFLASVAASSPAVMVAFELMEDDELAGALIYFKVLFAVASLFSIAVNLFGSRIFYGHIHLDLRNYSRTLRFAERVFLAMLGLMGVFSIGLLWSGSHTERAAAAALVLCLLFAYLNILSSLALARGRPAVSASAQAVVLIGAMSFALMLGGSNTASVLMFFCLVCALTLFSSKVRLTCLLQA